MFKSKAKKLLAVAMILAVALSLQIPTFAATINNMSLTLRTPASGTAGKVDIVVDADEFDGVGGNAIAGTVVLEMMTGGLGGSYVTVPGTTTQNVDGDTDEVVFSDVAIATEDLFYRATFNDTINDTQVEIELAPHSFNTYEFTSLFYTINGANIEISTATFDLGTTGTVDIGKSTDGGTNWTRVGQVTLAGTETVYTVTDTYPTQDTLYRIFYSPSDAERLKGYTEKVIVMSNPYRVGFFKPVTIPGYGKDPAALTVALGVPAAVDAGFGMTIALQSDANRIIHENMTLSQDYYTSLPAGYSLFAAVDLNLTIAGAETDTAGTVAALGAASLPVPFTIGGLRPGSQVAVVRVSGAIDSETYTTTMHTVDADGNINTEDEMIRELTTETAVGSGIYTSDNASTIFIYTNYAAPTPTPTPVPVSPSTGVYN